MSVNAESNKPNKRRKIRTGNNQIKEKTNPISLRAPTTFLDREFPRPHFTPKIVLASSVMADVYAYNATRSGQTSAPLSKMFSHDGSTDLKSTLLNKTTLAIQFSSCILPTRDGIQLVCRT
jgi:hypothetical protein